MVGLSILSGAHMTLFPKIIAMLRERGAEDIMVIGGGIIPQDEAAELGRQGVAAIFTPGAPTTEIVDFIKKEMASRL